MLHAALASTAEQSSTPLYRQLANNIATAIRQGSILPGTRLPTIRAMAEARKVDRNTVNRAYLLLAQQGLIESRPGRGTVVCTVPPVPRAPLAPGTQALACQGGHDFGLDILVRQLRPQGLQLQLAPVGANAGLAALAAGRAALAGSNLLDANGRSFNHDAIRQHLPGRALLLLTLAEREQGLIVPPGNPRGLRGLADLAHSSLQISTRSSGSGTRVLFDRLLIQTNIAPAALEQRIHCATTQLAAAAAVAAGRVDLGFGLHAAARALDLDFVPLAQDRFSLVLWAENSTAAWFGPLIETVAAPQFRAAIEALGGYDGTSTGWLHHVAP